MMILKMNDVCVIDFYPFLGPAPYLVHDRGLYLSFSSSDCCATLNHLKIAKNNLMINRVIGSEIKTQIRISCSISKIKIFLISVPTFVRRCFRFFPSIRIGLLRFICHTFVLICRCTSSNNGYVTLGTISIFTCRRCRRFLQ